ncbi:DUF2798 domain-containing protein [Ignatzschineria ureiclastica]|uniref:DUF2798 domain-containing protein n=1 Tax=Ignatzschineria ureiclastica TaxID=472582 RepID=A0A2U2AF19_9GAMM|nr:DUF2798 domain-containing protein [Ignatzschineria ureiclastica]PWD81251.1 DUF2798 domain-containing protein [Ignatzschineria ureiclastica]GGZ97494.1 hypothetical protein GCM10007162_12080 [Ignatzschineria ureiclastica]
MKQPSSLDRYKLPPQALHILVPLFLSGSMSCIVSLVSTLMSIGFAGFVFKEWLGAWMFSWLIAFPSVLILLPIMRKFASFFIRKNP